MKKVGIITMHRIINYGSALQAYATLKAISMLGYQAELIITGDGSFGMNLNELATAVRYNIPLVILIMNNGVLGMVRQWQTLFFDRHYSNTVLARKTDFVALSRAFGADGERVNTVDSLDAALSRAFKHDGPYLIDCSIDKDEFVLPMLPPGGSMDDIITKVGE